MSSTYSPNLAIELIGTGDQAGTWGTTTNTNLGTLIEQAISGYFQYTCSGGIDTITIPGGVSGVARNMYLELVGTGGGTLLVPINKKLYFIYNATAATITVKVNGQTGVPVPAGRKVSLVCNGTDVVIATNYMISPTFTTPALGTPASGVMTNVTGLPLTTGVTGTLPVANGGTGVTTSTGTGSVVLSTSPTLVTPVLGTPTSGTLTNCTNLPLTTGVTGVLPVANGGTGVSNTPTNGQILIGNSGINGYTLTTLTAGTGCTITNTAGGITINATGTGGSVTSVSGAGSVNGITLTGTVNTTGSLTLGGALTGVSLATQVTGTLPVANGGTGATTFTVGSLLKGNGTSAISAATGADIVAAIGATAVQNATNATNATTAASVTGSGSISSTTTATTQPLGTNNTTIATTAFVLANSIGWAAYRNVTSSRAWYTTYTNTMGRPIFVSISFGDNGPGSFGINIYINGVLFISNGVDFGGDVQFIVPVGATYYGDSAGPIILWFEM